MRCNILIFSLLLMSGFTHAQSLYNQSVISIGTSGVLFVKDTIINEGTIINNGDMQVGGSWINNSQYDAGQGQITFNSSLPQVINHSNQSFSKLTISGGGKKMILADITVEDEIVLTDGIIEAENNARVMIGSSASVSGGSDLAHINAPVYHHGAGTKIFPLGNGSVYLPVTLESVTDPSALIGIEGIELQSDGLHKAPSLNDISTTRYWHVDVATGSLDDSRITLPVRDEGILNNSANLENVVVVEASSLSENFRSVGQAASVGTPANGLVTSDKSVSMPYVALGTSTSDGGLIVYNAVSPNNDDQNEFLMIENVEYHSENKFTLFNRWGDKVFEIDNYDNAERVFRGKSNISGDKDLVNGTYFYIIETKDGLRVNGFLALKN